jgi:predicted ATP-dependent protease
MPACCRSIEAVSRRAARVEERAREMILRDIALIDTAGTRVGQGNGLSVMALAGHAFGRPTRNSARVRAGTGRIVDIAREVELGGPIHSKGVLILGGFLAGRYALEVPMSLYASLVFEQSYGGVEGDSASSAELYSLLSALAEVLLLIWAPMVWPRLLSGRRIQQGWRGGGSPHAPSREWHPRMSCKG